MKTPNTVWWAVWTAGCFVTQAVEFPLEVKEMTLKEARACPGGYGDTAMFSLERPSVLKKAPAAKSAHPLYAQTYLRTVRDGKSVSTPNLLFLFDESQGTGKGYDRMIVDLNRNGDLTDDAAFERLERQKINTDGEIVDFGPVPMPAKDKVGQWLPRFYTQIYLYQRPGSQQSGNTYLGYARLYTGSYLETTVDVNGVKQKFGVVDGNCNFKIGEPSALEKYTRQVSGQEVVSYYLRGSDQFLRDKNGSGKFERTLTSTDAEPFSGLIYFGPKAYTASLAEDLTSIRFAPYTEPVGELSVKKDVTDLTLVRETKDGDWTALTPGVKDGKAMVPTGAYRVANCTLGAQADSGTWTKTSTSEIKPDILRVTADQATRLEYGSPIKMELTAKKGQARTSESGMMGAVRGLFGSLAGPRGALEMNVLITGATGERYSGFYSSAQEQLPPPKFEVLDTAGKKLASGNFEFG